MLNFQAYLDRVVDSIMTEDSDAFCALLSVPFTLITADKTEIITDLENIRERFVGYVESLHGYGVTDLVRVAQQTIMIEQTLAIGVYETHILRRGQRMVPPFQSAITLRRHDSIWTAISVMNSVGHTNWTQMTRSALVPIDATEPKPDERGPASAGTEKEDASAGD